MARSECGIPEAKTEAVECAGLIPGDLNHGRPLMFLTAKLRLLSAAGKAQRSSSTLPSRSNLEWFTLQPDWGSANFPDRLLAPPLEFSSFELLLCFL